MKMQTNKLATIIRGKTEEKTEEELQDVIADSMGEEPKKTVRKKEAKVKAKAKKEDAVIVPTPPEPKHPNKPSKSVQFDPYIQRSVEIVQSRAGDMFKVLTCNNVHYEKNVEPLRKKSSFYYDNLASAVSMAKAFMSSDIKRMSTNQARQVKKVAKKYDDDKQLSFIDLL